MRRSRPCATGRIPYPSCVRSPRRPQEPIDEPRVDSPEADAVVEDLPPVVSGTEEVRANAVTHEWAGEVGVGAGATAVDLPEAAAVLEDLPPMVVGIEEVRTDAERD